ncbi:MAG: rod shape-determining protein MreC [Bacteroidales bacterium]
MYNLIRFLKRYYFIFLFLFLEGVSIYLISQNSYYQGSYITEIANEISGKINTYNSNIFTYFNLGSSNKALVKENAMLKSKIKNSYISFTKQEFIHQDTIYKQRFEYIEAKIIQKSINKRNNYFLLNKGKACGIEKNMSVICPQGIIGVVINVSENFSLVMSVLHQDSRINVKNTRTLITGTLLWDGINYSKGRIIDIPSSIPLKIGDTIATSGFSKDFPEGIMIGKITHFKMDKGSGFYDVDIKFSTDFNRIEHVYIVKNFFKTEQETLLKEIKDE